MPDLLPLLGVVVGGVLTWLATWGVQRSRARWESSERAIQSAREDRLRTESMRWEAYVEFLTNANILYSRARRPGLTVDPDQWRTGVFESMGSIDASMSAAFLVSADADTRSAIAAVVKASRELSHAVAQGPSDIFGLLHQQRDAVIAAEAEIREAIGFRDRSETHT